MIFLLLGILGFGSAALILLLGGVGTVLDELEGNLLAEDIAERQRERQRDRA